jgi:ATP-dependent DNA ligase
MPLPRWIEPQLSKLTAQAPTGPQWVHEVKFDGYRMTARIEKGQVQLLTRSSLDWTEKYPIIVTAFAQLNVNTAFIDGQLCGVRPDGVTAFEIMQEVSDSGGRHLTCFAFDLLHFDGENVLLPPLVERKARLAALLKRPPAGIAHSDHEGDGEAFRRAACKRSLEGVVSKRLDRPHLPGDCGAPHAADLKVASQKAPHEGGGALKRHHLAGMDRLVGRDDDLEALDRVVHMIGEIDVLVDRLEEKALLALA